MRKKGYYKQLVHDFPDHIFVQQRDPSSFRSWLNALANKKPIVLELGMGSGDFLLKQAKQDTESFYLGLEIKEDRIFKAYCKADQEKCTNMAFLQSAVEKIPSYDLPKVDSIYMFFPDPWPKKRHARRRMTSGDYLEIYKSILKAKGRLHFKTDNQNLFDYSRESLAKNNWKIVEQQENYSTIPEEQTYYEKLFLSENKSIYYLIASPPKDI